MTITSAYRIFLSSNTGSQTAGITNDFMSGNFKLAFYNQAFHTLKDPHIYLEQFQCDAGSFVIANSNMSCIMMRSRALACSDYTEVSATSDTGFIFSDVVGIVNSPVGTVVSSSVYNYISPLQSTTLGNRIDKQALANRNFDIYFTDNFGNILRANSNSSHGWTATICIFDRAQFDVSI